MKMVGKLLGFMVLLSAVAAPAAPADANASPSANGDTAKVAKRIELITDELAGEVGFAATISGADTVISLNGDEPFPMASTFKVAIAVAVLTRVDKGELRLDQLVDITPDMYVIGSNVLAQNFVHPGLKLSVANLIEIMIIESDNSATDIVIKLAGGPAAVTKNLRDIGINGQRIDRNTAEIIRDFAKLPGPATVAFAAEVAKTDPDFESRADSINLDFEKDPRDQSTPKAMLDLLLAIENGTALSAKSRDFLIGSMSRTRTGKDRLKGMLPEGTPVEHKTGTIGGVANDVGYVTFPDGRRMVIAVFTKSSTTPAADQERAIAETARTLYDYYADR
jgi:beta-lactamase class A